MRNVLIIKLRYLGDVLLATPTLRAIKAARPDVRLMMMVNRGTEDVLSGNPDLDGIMVLDKGSLAAQSRLIAGLRRRGFDTVVDLTDGDRSAFLSWISGASVRIGFNDEHRWRGKYYTQVVQSVPGVQHRIDRDLEALKPMGIQAESKDLLLRVTPEEVDSADQLLDRLACSAIAVDGDIAAGRAVLVQGLASGAVRGVGGSVDLSGWVPGIDWREQRRSRSRAADSTMAKSRPTILAGRTTIKQFAAIAKRSALFVGSDSGAMHIAAAVGTSVVALFGPSNPREWGPRGGPAEMLYKELDCRICFHPTCTRGEENCMRFIA